MAAVSAYISIVTLRLPSSAVGKNPPANGGDLDLMPGLRGFHMLHSGWASAPQLLSPRARVVNLSHLNLLALGPWAPTTEPVCCNSDAHVPTACAPEQEQPAQREAHTLQQGAAPAGCSQGKPWKDWGQEAKGSTEDEMIGWHHRLNGHEFEQTLGDSEGQESLACCSPWGHKQLDMNEWLNNRYIKGIPFNTSRTHILLEHTQNIFQVRSCKPKTSLSKFKKTEIIPAIFSDHNLWN